MDSFVHNSELPLPPHFNSENVGQVWRVPYEQRAAEARRWAEDHTIQPVAADQVKIALLGVDVQNTFCIPGFELYVGGRSGTGAVDDNRRLVEFIYRNLSVIHNITLTLDTHRAIQIFHAIFLVDQQGNHPAPYTLVTVQDVQSGRWRFNPAAAPSLGVTTEYGQAQLEHYVHQLSSLGKYDLTIWPYHSMIDGIGHALVPAVEEAIFFHTIARNSQADFFIKGENPLTESYSAIGPEVTDGPRGEQIGRKSMRLLQRVLDNDMLIIAGQAKSHCVAWTVEDLLTEIRSQEQGDLARRRLANRIYLLEDCSSPVVVPGADYTDQANAAYQKFAEAGMHVVRSTDPIASWPGLPVRA